MHNSISVPAPLCRLCCIDDSRTSAFVTKRLLTRQGYQVDHFVSAELAIEAIFEYDYGLIITDLMLAKDNELNGDDFIRLIRNCGHQSKNKIPIIVLTGTSDRQTHETLKTLGANAILCKPLDEILLNKTIEKIVAFADVIPLDSQYSVPSLSNPSPSNAHQFGANTQEVATSQPDSYDDSLTALPLTLPTIDWAIDMPMIEMGVEKIECDNLSIISSEEVHQNVVKPPVQTKQFDDLTLQDIEIGDPSEPILVRSQARAKSGRHNFGDLSFDDIAGGVNVREGTDSTRHQESLKPNFASLTLDDLAVSVSDPDGLEQSIVTDDTQSDIPTLTELSQQPYKVDVSSPVNTSEKAEKLPEKTLETPKVVEPDTAQNVAQEVLPDKPTVSATPPLSVLDKALAAASEDDAVSSPSQAENSAVLDSPLLSLLDDLVKDEPLVKEKVVNQKNQKTPNKIQLKAFFGWKMACLVVVAIVIGVVEWQFKLLPQRSFVVQTAVVEQGPIHASISVSGKVMSTKHLDLTTYESGQIVDIYVKEGARVKQGDVLARLDDVKAKGDVNRYQAKLLSMQEEVSLSNKIRERLQRALNLGAVSRQMVEDAEATWKAASARQTEAEEELKSAQLTLTRTQVIAQFDGLITKRHAQPGQWVAPPEPIVTLVDTTQLAFGMSVNAVDVSKLKIGQTVIMSSESIESIAGKKWREQIVHIAPATTQDNIANMINVHVSLKSQVSALKMGQVIDAEIRLVSIENAVKVPFEALISEDGQSKLAVYQEGRVRIVPIKIGIEDFTHVEIVKGISIDDKVILPEGKTLEDGQKVSLLNSVV